MDSVSFVLCFAPSEVIADCAIGERLKRSCLPCNLLSFIRPCRVNRAPVHDTSGRIARFATLSFPAYGVNVFTAPKKTSKKTARKTQANKKAKKSKR